jgi:hypothetical protein
MLERIARAEKLLAVILRASYHAEGIVFFTPGDFSQQLGYMQRPAGYLIPPHVHNEISREVTLTSEVLFLRAGRVRVDFYDEDHSYLESRVLSSGDIILLARGGHGFEMLEPSEIIEVKQGPYSGDADKTRFQPAVPAQPRIVGE